MKKDTSWGGVAEWYDSYLETDKDSYQAKVILPGLVRLLDIEKGMSVLDLACGQGYFSRAFAEKGALVTGADIGAELIAIAKKRSPNIPFHVTPAHKLGFAQGETFDAVVIVLAIQNIGNMLDVFKEARRVLKPGGRLILVMNHPAFRIPRRSGWGYSAAEKKQFREVSGYLSESAVPIIMHPGQKDSESTVSYHRSLQDYSKALGKAGFAISRIEEWISHKKSQAGPRQEAEDTARKEIPLFLMLETTKI